MADIDAYAKKGLMMDWQWLMIFDEWLLMDWQWLMICDDGLMVDDG